MGCDDEYYIPVKVEDEIMQYVAVKAIEVLKQNSKLENIFQKNISAYNTTLEEKSSANTLQVMNQNRKPIFSSITPSGAIKSPRCSKVSTTIDAKSSNVFESNDQVLAPNKSRLDSKTERKRLSFDVGENEDSMPVRSFTKTSDGSEVMITSPNMMDRKPIKLIVDERRNIRNLDASPSHSMYEENNKAAVSPNIYLEERLSLEGKPETITSLSTYDEDTEYVLHKIQDDQERVTRHEKKDTTILDSYVHEENNSNYKQIKLSSFSSTTESQEIQNKLNFEGKPKILLNRSIQNTAIEPEIFLEKQQTNVVDFEKRNKRSMSDPGYGKGSSRGLEISPAFFSSKEETKIFCKPNTNEKKSFLLDEHPDTNSSRLVDHQKVSFISNKTAVKCQITIDSVAKKKRTPEDFTECIRETVKIPLKAEEIFTFKKDVKIPVNANGSKRKSVDCSEETMVSTCLEDKDKTFVSPFKIAKFDEKFSIDDKKTMILDDISQMNDLKHFNHVDESGKKDTSPNTIDECALNSKDFINFVDDKCITDNNSINRDNDKYITNGNLSNLSEISATEEKDPLNYTENKSIIEDSSISHTTDCPALDYNDSFNRDDEKYVIDDFLPNKNINRLEFMSVSPDEKSKMSAYTDYFLPHPERSLTMVDSHTSSCNNDKNGLQHTVSQNTKDIESLTSLMQNLSPSVKRFFDDASTKPIFNRSVSDDARVVRQLCLQESLPKSAKSPRHHSVPNVKNLKLYNKLANEGVKFVKTLKMRRARMHTYLTLFAEDRNDLKFILVYINKVTDVVRLIPTVYYEAELLEHVQDFLEKALKLQSKATSWKFNVEKDLLVWSDCMTKIKQIKEDIKKFEKEKGRQLKPTDFQTFEKCLRTINKKADEMTLLREVRRPSFLQFGYELENFIHLFIRCIQAVGILKSSSNISKD